jgi:hypothetical protein
LGQLVDGLPAIGRLAITGRQQHDNDCKYTTDADVTAR